MYTFNKYSTFIATQVGGTIL